jgi:hypothetical protein
MTPRSPNNTSLCDLILSRYLKDSDVDSHGYVNENIRREAEDKFMQEKNPSANTNIPSRKMRKNTLSK